MTLLHSLLLGIVQGLTEFLPLSSTAHLLILERFLHIPLSPSDLHAFNVLLHTGSILALIVFYGSDLWQILVSPFRHDKMTLRSLGFLFLATLPAALTGFFLRDVLTTAFHSLTAVSIQMLTSAGILILAELCRAGSPRLYGMQALLIGMTQAFALVPGLSRLGLAISAGRAVGLSRRKAVDFSLLLARTSDSNCSILRLSAKARNPIR